MDYSILKKINLSDKEIKIYLALLENGAASVRELSEITGLNRGTAYDILKDLQNSSLVSFYQQETKQKFVAENPEKLFKLVEEKEKELSEARSSLEVIIPELKSLQDKTGGRPTAKLFEDKKGIRVILDDLMAEMFKQKEAAREYYIYSSKHASEDIYNAFPSFTKERIKNKIKVKSISLASGGGVHGLDERRWLGSDDKSATFILIYAGKCAFISRDSFAKPVGVIIENSMIYETQKMIFLKLWESLGK
jgi:sugar-specific transcriptional regulator TrmB